MSTIVHSRCGDAVPSHLDFLVGQDPSGHWLALETHGLAGGLFASRDAAIRFALVETDRRPDAVHVTAEPIEFHT
jgi:hypothetical protein